MLLTFTPVIIFVTVLNPIFAFPFLKQCLIHLIHSEAYKNTALPWKLLSNSRHTIAIQQITFYPQHNRSHADQINDILLKIANSVRKHTTQCYAQFHDLVSYFDANNITHAENKVSQLQNTILPIEQSYNLELYQSPSHIFFFTKPGDQYVQFSQKVYNSLKHTLFLGTQYFEISGDTISNICLFCNLISQHTLNHIQSEEDIQPHNNFHLLPCATGFLPNSLFPGRTSCEFPSSDQNVAIVKHDVCISLFISRKYNFTFAREDDYPRKVALKSKLVASFNTMFNRDHSFIKKLDRDMAQPNSYCKQWLGYSLRLYIHKNVTGINLQFALTSAYNVASWGAIIGLGVGFALLRSTWWSSRRGNVVIQIVTETVHIVGLFLNQPLPVVVSRYKRHHNAFAIFAFSAILTLYLFSVLYSAVFISYFSARPMVTLPQNIDDVVVQEDQKMLLITTSDRITGTDEDPRGYLKNQILGQYLLLWLKKEDDVQWEKRITSLFNSILEPRYFSPMRKIVELLFNLTYKIPVTLIRRNGTTASTDVGTYESSVVRNGVFGMVDTEINTKFAEMITKRSGKYVDIIEPRSYYDPELEFDSGSIHFKYQKKFMGSMFHKRLASFDNMGLCKMWIEKRRVSPTEYEGVWDETLNKAGIDEAESRPDEETGLDWDKVVVILNLTFVLFGLAVLVFMLEYSFMFILRSVR
ncbi:hypothetical protein Fcan01_11421 [Folsomia candida]|uniref:Uncharacterized protein n=1 Tax=Folsomia candida TaxID=158441 RepID=A0A226E8J0_FOLCA|nr:hypothetical protein Fcan01_11421 [Folsomia candida]